MLALLQSTVDPAAISVLGTVFGLGGLVLTGLWLRAFYRSSGV